MKVSLRKVGTILTIIFGYQAMRALNLDAPFYACSFKRSLDVCMQIASELKACEYEQKHHNGALPSQEFCDLMSGLFKEFSYHVAHIDAYRVYKEDVRYLERLYTRTRASYEKTFPPTIFSESPPSTLFSEIATSFDILLTQEQPLPLRCPPE